MKKIALIVLGIVLCVSTASAEAVKSTIDDQSSVEVTVYNSNVGLVKDTRTVNLPAGEGELRFMDVASAIQPVTVAVKSINAPDKFSILEQNYEYDLMSPQKLLDKYVGQSIKLIAFDQDLNKVPPIDAVLLSNNNGEIYQIGDEIYLGYPGYKVLPKIPENLIAKPTLTWLFKNTSANPQQLEVSYLTNDISWKADYVMTVDQNDTNAALNGWVTVDNRSGAMYQDARLKLVAGELNRVRDERVQTRAMAKGMTLAAEADSFSEEAFFEYHIYDLQRPTTIKDNQTKQISLLEADGIGIQKELIVYGQSYYYQSRQGQFPEAKVGVYLKFKNEEKNHLGMPLPAGTIRLYKADSKGKLQFIGEDRINHTPKDEEITLKIGDAFDVVAERKQMDFQNLGTTAVETKWLITLRNHKDEDIVVTVIEPVVGEWQVMDSSHKYEKLDAQNIKFLVPVEKNGEAKLIYRLRVNYR